MAFKVSLAIVALMALAAISHASLAPTSASLPPTSASHPPTSPVGHVNDEQHNTTHKEVGDVPPNSDSQNLPQDYVNAHNKARKEVGVPFLKWNQKLEDYAVKFIKTRSEECELNHSAGQSPYVEIVANGWGELTGVDAVNLWVDEKSSYDPDTNACVDGDCIHYRIIVNRKITDVGCARARCQNGGVLVVCEYWPMINGDERPY